MMSKKLKLATYVHWQHEQNFRAASGIFKKGPFWCMESLKKGTFSVGLPKNTLK